MCGDPNVNEYLRRQADVAMRASLAERYIEKYGHVFIGLDADMRPILRSRTRIPNVSRPNVS